MVCSELFLTSGMGHFAEVLLVLSCVLFLCEECSEVCSEPTGVSEVGLFADASMGSDTFQVAGSSKISTTAINS